ncbi:MAG: hypothetical protein ACYDBS_09420, partial [Acidimicrobiales bacterium]
MNLEEAPADRAAVVREIEAQLVAAGRGLPILDGLPEAVEANLTWQERAPLERAAARREQAAESRRVAEKREQAAEASRQARRRAGLGLSPGRVAPDDSRAPEEVVPAEECFEGEVTYDYRRRERYTRRRVAATLARRLREEEGVARRTLRESCGRPDDFSDVSLHRQSGQYFFRALLSCQSVWSCPVCAPKIRYQRGLEVEQALRNFEGRFP